MSEKISIVLFGLTGQGKSSIANMLIQGDIYHNKDNSFKINNKVEGASFQIQYFMNNEFIVYDTIGVGEPDTGSVPHTEAVEKLRNYFSTCEVPLNYIAFVKKKDRWTEQDCSNFKIFKEIFKESEKIFIIIITECKQKWVDENINTLRNNVGTYPIIPVDFPFEDPEDEDDVVFQERKRKQSIQILTENLSRLNYEPMKLQVLSSNMTFETKVDKILELVPVAGSTYNLISSGVYYKLGKQNLAEERFINGFERAVLDAMSVGIGTVVSSSGKVITESAGNVATNIAGENVGNLGKLVNQIGVVPDTVAAATKGIETNIVSKVGSSLSKTFL
ncbi:5533_t:CDS:1 [Funneliformis caledonium]|uniref:5533_t:CDS:1 n=1 Tax=Funneliformis caledonium TaxID=1117310 RepID=A0A9N9H5R9_9GLOM|nr:5533_t:CDS:1 [Funneliformis caledonium]